MTPLCELAVKYGTDKYPWYTPLYDELLSHRRIDDGSHSPAHQLSTLIAFSPLLRSNGLYIIEDARPQSLPFPHYNIETSEIDGKRGRAVILWK